MSMSQFFRSLRSTTCISATVVNHHKSQWMSLESSVCPTMPNYSANSSCSHMASITSNDQRDGVFLPKGTVHLLGLETYEQVLKDNNFFLTTVATVPINLEYDAWFAIIDPTTTSNTDTISLHDHLLCKPWFLQIESIDCHKCLLIMMKSNHPEAHAWIAANLELLIRKSIPAGIDLPQSQLQCQLDKPVYLASSQSYADVLKKQFSLVLTAMTPRKANN